MRAYIGILPTALSSPSPPTPFFKQPAEYDAERIVIFFEFKEQTQPPTVLQRKICAQVCVPNTVPVLFNKTQKQPVFWIRGIRRFFGPLDPDLVFFAKNGTG
jgi:hypothetical protein